ncbi:hypothetical protein N9Q18_01455 [bacterium]|nr:hypothetical protein [bacterium]
MSFLVIEAADGLTDTGRRRAARAGPDAVLTRSAYPALLRSAGFGCVEFEDRTAEYGATQQAWIDATDRHCAGLREALGEDEFAERRRARAASLAAIDDGVLRRRRYVATAPSGPSPDDGA